MTALLLTSFLFAQSLTQLPVSSLSFDANELKKVFNSSKDGVRIITVISPTCGHCLQGLAEIQQILESYPDSRIKVMVLWTPLLRNDSKAAAEIAATYLPDSRADHFWDLWSFGRNTYSRQLNCPMKDAWDLMCVYEPGLTWESSPPEPTIWFQRRNLEIGEAYTREKLEAAVSEHLR